MLHRSDSGECHLSTSDPKLHYCGLLTGPGTGLAWLEGWNTNSGFVVGQ